MVLVKKLCFDRIRDVFKKSKGREDAMCPYAELGSPNHCSGEGVWNLTYLVGNHF